MSPSAREQRLAHRAQRQTGVREREARIGRHRGELARQDGVERGQPVVAEQLAIALGRVLQPVVLGLLGQLDQAGRERHRLGRYGAAGIEMEPAHFLAQGVHVGIGVAELAESLVHAEHRVLRERDAGGMAGAHQLVQLDQRLVDARRKARRAAPGDLARRLRHRGQALAHRDGVDGADREGDLDVQAVVRRGGVAREAVGHECQASTLAPRATSRLSYEQRFPSDHGRPRYLVTIVPAYRGEIS